MGGVYQSKGKVVKSCRCICTVGTPNNMSRACVRGDRKPSRARCTRSGRDGHVQLLHFAAECR